MAGVTVTDLEKTYDGGDIVAVEDLSLEIDDGEFVTVVGPSGCGKTTTLRMLAGLERPTSGSIHIGDKDVTDIPAKRRDIAMVFQNYALYPHKTVFENMEFGLRMSTDLGAAKRRDRVEEVATMMDIGGLLEKKPDELSGGQKQRVALGRSIVREPDVFLFDEPLSNLDAKLRTTMRTEIQRLQNELGVTSIYVTHDQEEAMTMGDRIVILNDGNLQQVGSPKQVYNNPVNEFVAGFIGSPSMNFIDVTVGDRAGGIRLSDADENVQFDLSREYLHAAESDLSAETYTLGIRPENVLVGEQVDEPVGTGTVEVVEPVGADNYLYLDVAPEFIARVEADIEPEVGDVIPIGFDESDIHLFDPETGEDVFVEPADSRIPA